MNDQPFSTNVLTLEVLDAICERLENRPSALNFLIMRSWYWKTT